MIWCAGFLWMPRISQRANASRIFTSVSTCWGFYRNCIPRRMKKWRNFYATPYFKTHTVLLGALEAPFFSEIRFTQTTLIREQWDEMTSDDTYRDLIFPKPLDGTSYHILYGVRIHIAEILRHSFQPSNDPGRLLPG